MDLENKINQAGTGINRMELIMKYIIFYLWSIIEKKTSFVVTV